MRIYKNRQLKIVFSDNGSGIDPETLKHILEPFVSTKSTGTGLGMAVCNQIMNLHNGDMTVTSKLGKGTSVSLCFPLGSRADKVENSQ